MTRLGSFLYARILRDGKDERFNRIKQNWLSFLGAWTVQAVWVMLVELPVILINLADDASTPTSPLLVAVDVACLLLWAAGFLIEATADAQKMVFRSDPANKSRYITDGLWAYSRHPNYFGEILMWTAMATAVSAAGLFRKDTSMLYSFVSPAFTALLLLKVTGVPMVEAAGEHKWGDDPAYRHYMENTSKLFLWRSAPPFTYTAGYVKDMH